MSNPLAESQYRSAARMREKRHRYQKYDLLEAEDVDTGQADGSNETQMNWAMWWDKTVERWHQEGLPTHLTDVFDIHAYFGLDPYKQFWFSTTDSTIEAVQHHVERRIGRLDLDAPEQRVPEALRLPPRDVGRARILPTARQRDGRGLSFRAPPPHGGGLEWRGSPSPTPRMRLES